jgi:hypothetical protein
MRTNLNGGLKARSALTRAFAERFHALVEHLADQLPEEAKGEAVSSADPIRGLASALAEAAVLDPPRDPLAAARARGVGARAELLEEAGGALRLAQVAERLGTTSQAVHGRRSRGSILAVPLPHGEHVYPACQFTPEGILPGLREFLAAFRAAGPWSQLETLLRDSPDLDGRSPLEALREGDLAGAVRVAAGYGEHLG